jgi:cobalt/nickel transport system permease protein
MHISEGVLTAPVLAGGAVLASAGLALGLRELKADRVPQVAVLSSAFFVGSLIHIPFGPVSIHLILNGINGMILGWAAFPSIFVALVLQALLFQYGGITVLGVNTVIMALPAVISYYLFGRSIRAGSAALAWLGGFGAGFSAVAFGALLISFSLILSGEGFREPAAVVVTFHLPVMITEGIITGFCIAFLRKVKPEILNVSAGMIKEGKKL